jgi:hypothetical protein
MTGDISAGDKGPSHRGEKERGGRKYAKRARNKGKSKIGKDGRMICLPKWMPKIVPGNTY